jgi:hypothetical protein
MKYNKVDFSHCSFQFDTLIYESEWPSGRKIEKSKWLKTYKPIHEFSLPYKSQDQLEEMRQWLEIAIHRPYSIWQLVAIGVGLMSSKLRHFLFGHDVNGSSALICTELVAEFYRIFYGYDFKKNNDYVDLADIYKATKEITLTWKH